MAPQRDNCVKVSALLHAGHKLREVANLVGVSRTTYYTIKKRMDDDEGVNRCAAVVEGLLWIVAACGMTPVEAVSAAVEFSYNRGCSCGF